MFCCWSFLNKKSLEVGILRIVGNDNYYNDFQMWHNVKSLVNIANAHRNIPKNRNIIYKSVFLIETFDLGDFPPGS